MSALQPCLACRRHVRAAEASCPFCHAAMPEAVPRPMLTQRVGRAAMFAFGAAVTVTAAGCGQAATPGTDAASTDDAGHDASIYGMADAAYGGPPIDAAVSDDASEVDTGLAAAYGAPPVDAALPDTGTQALYGAPPPPPTPPER